MKTFKLKVILSYTVLKPFESPPQKKWSNTFGSFNISGWCTGGVDYWSLIHMSSPDWSFTLSNVTDFQSFTTNIDQVIVLWALISYRFIFWSHKCFVALISIFAMSDLMSCCCLFVNYKIPMAACQHVQLSRLCCSVLLLMVDSKDNVFALVTKLFSSVCNKCSLLLMLAYFTRNLTCILFCLALWCCIIRM
jgi:hypothetical protein